MVKANTYHFFLSSPSHTSIKQINTFWNTYVLWFWKFLNKLDSFFMIKSKKISKGKAKILSNGIGNGQTYSLPLSSIFQTVNQILENYSNPDLMMISRPILTTLLSKQDSTKSSKIWNGGEKEMIFDMAHKSLFGQQQRPEKSYLSST